MDAFLGFQTIEFFRFKCLGSITSTLFNYNRFFRLCRGAKSIFLIGFTPPLDLNTPVTCSNDLEAKSLAFKLLIFLGSRAALFSALSYYNSPF